MDVCFDYKVGAIYLTAESKEEEQEIYEFFVENRNYETDFRMNFLSKTDQFDEDEPRKEHRPMLTLTCEQQ